MDKEKCNTCDLTMASLHNELMHTFPFLLLVFFFLLACFLPSSLPFFLPSFIRSFFYSVSSLQIESDLLLLFRWFYYFDIIFFFLFCFVFFCYCGYCFWFVLTWLVLRVGFCRDYSSLWSWSEVSAVVRVVVEESLSSSGLLEYLFGVTFLKCVGRKTLHLILRILLRFSKVVGFFFYFYFFGNFFSS